MGMSRPNRAIKWMVDNEYLSCDPNTGEVLWGSGYNRKSSRSGPHIRATSTGYRRIALMFRGKKTQMAVHRIVAYSVWGDSLFGRGLVVHHKNHDRADNRAQNLELLLVEENARRIDRKRRRPETIKRKMGKAVKLLRSHGFTVVDPKQKRTE